jgi:inositol hexakisphosphate/diphosphoinositol-pentakisphosphate kinase
MNKSPASLHDPHILTASPSSSPLVTRPPPSPAVSDSVALNAPPRANRPSISSVNRPRLGPKKPTRISDVSPAQSSTLSRQAGEPSRRMTPSGTFMLPEAALRPVKDPDPETESNRLSFSSLYSLSSAIIHGARGLAGSGPSSIAGSEPDHHISKSFSLSVY